MAGGAPAPPANRRDSLDTRSRIAAGTRLAATSRGCTHQASQGRARMSAVDIASMELAGGSAGTRGLALRPIVNHAVTCAEVEAIRHALELTNGNKSRAARLLRTNYTTLHAKMRRHGISAREFHAPA
jgi:DNA-binding NtrC family response regulator